MTMENKTIKELKENDKLYKICVISKTMEIPQQITTQKKLKFFKENMFKEFNCKKIEEYEIYDIKQPNKTQNQKGYIIFKKRGMPITLKTQNIIENDIICIVWEYVKGYENIIYYTPNKKTVKKILKKYHKENIKNLKEYNYFTKLTTKQLITQQKKYITTIRNVITEHYLKLIK